MLVKIISTMIEATYTTDDLIERLGLLRKYYDVVLFTEATSATVREVLEGKCDDRTLRLLEIWVSTFEKQKIQPLVVYETLDTVQEEVAGVPAITLYVPVRFNIMQVEQLGKWFRENVQPNILLSLRIDPRTTGGCAFIWNDEYHNYSLRYYIEKEREEIDKVFNKYTHVQ